MAEWSKSLPGINEIAGEKETPFVVDEEAIRRKHKKKVRFARFTLCVLLVAGWEIATRLHVMDTFYWSSPSIIASTAWQKATQGNLLADIAYTSGSTLLGFVLGTVTGSLIGLSFWWSRTYADISEPFLIVLNALPKLALAPVLVILFGIGFASKVILAFSMTVVVSALAAFSGVKSVDPAMETLMYSLGASRMQVFTKVVIPWSMPWMISSLRVNIALALAGAIVGEFIVSNKGVGRMIIYAGTTFDIKLVWVGVVVLSLLSILMYCGVVLLEKWLSNQLTIINHT